MSEGIDEMLSEAVREYPALYDKSKKGHHDRTVTKNCWKCHLEDDKEAVRLFGNLKNGIIKREARRGFRLGVLLKIPRNWSRTPTFRV